tara:strand:+ start:346 stop:453 length:108 start_codon:yes stop_codon:yes gene_type:complete
MIKCNYSQVIIIKRFINEDFNKNMDKNIYFGDLIK